MRTIITIPRRPARIVVAGGRVELRAGKRGLGRLVGQATDTATGRETLRQLAGRNGLYVYHEEPAEWRPVAGLLGVERANG